MAFSHVLRAKRWLIMLEPLGFKIKLKNSIMAVFATYLINYGIPRSGEVARAAIISNYEKVPFNKAFGTIVAERIIDTLALFIVLTFTLVLNFKYVLSLFDGISIVKLSLLLLLALFLFFLFYIIFKRTTNQLTTKIKNFVKGLSEGLLSILQTDSKGQFIAYTLAIWGLYVLMFYLGIQAFDKLKMLPLSATFIGFIAGSFSIVATNGGTGGYPEAMVLAFSLFGISANLSRAFGWVIWGAQTIMTIIIGGLCLLFLPIFNNKLKTNYKKQPS